MHLTGSHDRLEDRRVLSPLAMSDLRWGYNTRIRFETQQRERLAAELREEEGRRVMKTRGSDSPSTKICAQLALKISKIGECEARSEANTGSRKGDSARMEAVWVQGLPGAKPLCSPPSPWAPVGSDSLWAPEQGASKAEPRSHDGICF